MRKCCFCGKVEPVDNLHYNEDEDENAHLLCIRKNMNLRTNRALIKKADNFAFMLVGKDRNPPK